jgi:hypothetical protein
MAAAAGSDSVLEAQRANDGSSAALHVHAYALAVAAAAAYGGFCDAFASLAVSSLPRAGVWMHMDANAVAALLRCGMADSLCCAACFSVGHCHCTQLGMYCSASTVGSCVHLFVLAQRIRRWQHALAHVSVHVLVQLVAPTLKKLACNRGSAV